MSVLYPKTKAKAEYSTIIQVTNFFHFHAASPNLKPKRAETGKISNLKFHLL